VSKVVFVSPDSPTAEVIELKDPIVAAVLGWLIPGLGHLYQGRTAKGLLFLICILSTYFFGLSISEGRTVYATRLPYLCQAAVGLPAMPALVQAYWVRRGHEPLWGGLMAPPANDAMLNEWYKKMNRYFEMGTVYTMIAGLLNILAIYDAWGGPVPPTEEEKRRKDDDGAPDS